MQHSKFNGENALRFCTLFWQQYTRHTGRFLPRWLRDRAASLSSHLCIIGAAFVVAIVFFANAVVWNNLSGRIIEFRSYCVTSVFDAIDLYAKFADSNRSSRKNISVDQRSPYEPVNLAILNLNQSFSWDVEVNRSACLWPNDNRMKATTGIVWRKIESVWQFLGKRLFCMPNLYSSSRYGSCSTVLKFNRKQFSERRILIHG